MNKAATALQEKIHQAIPLSEAMGYRIVELNSTGIIVEGPLDMNVNIHGTGFAGSIYSLGILSAWALVYHVLDDYYLDAELVIARADIKYRAPVRGAIRRECQLSSKQLQTFIDALHKNNRARIEAEVNVGKSPEARLHITLFASRKESKRSNDN